MISLQLLIGLWLALELGLVLAEPTDKSLRFVHITKTGGTSLEEISNFTWGIDDTDYEAAVSFVKLTQFHEKYEDRTAFWHMPLMFVPHEVLMALLLKYDYFTVVRNPFSRVISEYHDNWGGPALIHNTSAAFNEWISERLSFVQRQLSALEIHRRCATSAKTSKHTSTGGCELSDLKKLSSHDTNKEYILRGHWTPQWIYTIDMSGNQIIPSERILKFESIFRNPLNRDFENLVKGYRVEKAYSLKTREGIMVHMLNNKLKKKYSIRDLSVSNMQLIRRVYSEDFRLFGYNPDFGTSLGRRREEQERPKRLKEVKRRERHYLSNF
jgi:hypothetical protein